MRCWDVSLMSSLHRRLKCVNSHQTLRWTQQWQDQSVSKPRPEDMRVGKPEPYAPGKDFDDWDFTFNGHAGTLDPAYPVLLKTAVLCNISAHDAHTKKGAWKVVRKAGNNGFEAYRQLCLMYGTSDQEGSTGLFVQILVRLNVFLELVRRYDEANGTDPFPDQVKKACIISNTPDPLKTHLQLNVGELGNFNAFRVATEDYLRSRRIFKTTSAGNTHTRRRFNGSQSPGKGKAKKNPARAKVTEKRQQNTHDSKVNVETVESVDTKQLIVGTSRRHLKVKARARESRNPRWQKSVKLTAVNKSMKLGHQTRRHNSQKSSEHDWMRRWLTLDTFVGRQRRYTVNWEDQSCSNPTGIGKLRSTSWWSILYALVCTAISKGEFYKRRSKTQPCVTFVETRRSSDQLHVRLERRLWGPDEGNPATFWSLWFPQPSDHSMWQRDEYHWQTREQCHDLRQKQVIRATGLSKQYTDTYRDSHDATWHKLRRTLAYFTCHSIRNSLRWICSRFTVRPDGRTPFQYLLCACLVNRRTPGGDETLFA